MNWSAQKGYMSTFHPMDILPFRNNQFNSNYYPAQKAVKYLSVTSNVMYIS
jgi:hypothetical protein